MKKAFITGITGSLGTEITRQLLEQEYNVVGYSRDELKQQRFQTHDNLTLYLGDVRDRDRLIEATRGCDVIFHFAALKHVDKCEQNPEEAFKTNLWGTDNILHAQRVNNIPRVVLTSTDKAVYSVTTYGCSKFGAERLVLRNPNNVVCRYGNVLASRGSFIESLVTTLRTESKAYLVDANMTRFWITIEDAAKFVLEKGFGKKGGLYIPPMDAASITCLMSAVANAANVQSYTVENKGSRGVEKIHECLRSEFEGEEVHSNTGPQFTEEELFIKVRPIVAKLCKR